MTDRRDFERAIYFTKLSVYLAFVWPHPRSAKKSEILKHDIIRFLSIINTLCTLIPVICSIYVYRDDSVKFAKSVACLGSSSSTIVRMIMSRVKCKQSQILIEEMQTFVKIARPKEKEVLQRYVKKFLLFHTVLSGSIYVASSLLILKPLIMTDQLFPFDAIYPFNVDSGMIMYLIYIQHAICLMQNAASVNIDRQSALIMWFAGARLEMLAEELVSINCNNELRNIVRKHIRFVSYARKASNEMRYIVFISSTNIAIVAIMCALQLLSNAPFFEKLTFALSTVICTIILYVSASPADNLIDVFDLMANAVYNTSWIDMPTEMTKSLLIIIQRCQRPIIVSIPGFIPALSLNFYASFLSALYTYFTALQVIMTPHN